MIISGRQQRDSAIHIQVSVLPETPLPSRLPHNIEQSSLCYTVAIHCIFLAIHFIFLIYLFLTVLGLCGCAQTFSSCDEQRLLSPWVAQASRAVASLVAEHGL